MWRWIQNSYLWVFHKVRWVQFKLQRLPILDLCNYGSRIHVDALKEVSSNLFWSTMPIWLSSFIMLVSLRETDKSVAGILSRNISNGELFLYSASILAPVYYMVLRERKGKKDFPNRLSQMNFVWVIMLLSAVVMVFQRINYPLDPRNTFWISVVFFITAIILLYSATVYNNASLNPAEEMAKNQNDFGAQFDEHRKQQ